MQVILQGLEVKETDSQPRGLQFNTSWVCVLGKPIMYENKLKPNETHQKNKKNLSFFQISS